MSKRKNGESEEDYLNRKLKRYKKKLDKLAAQDAESDVEDDTEKNDQAAKDTEHQEDLSLPDLPEEFLIALGEEGNEKEERGPEIRPELASRWSKLMCTGLGKETIDIISKKYPIPSNFSNAEAPRINPEILASLSEITIKRDKRIVHRQNLTGKIMCALGKTLNSVLKGDINSKAIIEQVNDAAKLCCEIHFQDSASRKFFALAGTNQTIRDAVRDSKPDKLLFGESCAENIKAAQAIKKASFQLKASDPPIPRSSGHSTHMKPTKNQPSTKKQGNWRGPPQQYQQRGRGGHRPPLTRKYYLQQRDQKKTQRPRQTHRQ